MGVISLLQCKKDKQIKNFSRNGYSINSMESRKCAKKYKSLILFEKTPFELQINGEISKRSNSLSFKSLFDIKKNITDFKYLKLIGVGTYGKVFLVSDKKSKNLYAVKELIKKSILTEVQMKNIKIEREIMIKFDYPFLMKLEYAFENEKKFYFLSKFMIGGELNFHIYKENYFSEQKAKFYAAEILLAINHLHKNKIIYRDLKPENVLIDRDGHIKLTDFGLSKICNNRDCRTKTLCGTPEYMCPDMIFGNDYGIEIDFWSFGVVLYEMLSGYLPFKILPEDKMNKSIFTHKIKMFDHFSKEAKDIINHLLILNPAKRYNFEKIKKHKFFSGINWKNLVKKMVIPPFIPQLDNQNICKYFDSENEINQSIVEKNNCDFLFNENNNTSIDKTIENYEFNENNKQEKEEINFYLNFDLNNTNYIIERSNYSLSKKNNNSDFYYSNSINNDLLKTAIYH